MLKKFPTTTTGQGSKLGTRHGYLDSIGNPHPQHPFSALNPFLPPQFACLRPAETFSTCTLLVHYLYSTGHRLSLIFITSASPFTSQAGSWANTKVATPGTAFGTRTSRSRVENQLIPQSVPSLLYRLAQTTPSSRQPRSLTCSSTDIDPTFFLTSHVAAYAISNQPQIRRRIGFCAATGARRQRPESGVEVEAVNAWTDSVYKHCYLLRHPQLAAIILAIASSA